MIQVSMPDLIRDEISNIIELDEDLNSFFRKIFQVDQSDILIPISHRPFMTISVSDISDFTIRGNYAKYSVRLRLEIHGRRHSADVSENVTTTSVIMSIIHLLISNESELVGTLLKIEDIETGDFLDEGSEGSEIFTFSRFHVIYSVKEKT